jgi:hypothetical protein
MPAIMQLILLNRRLLPTKRSKNLQFYSYSLDLSEKHREFLHICMFFPIGHYPQDSGRAAIPIQECN